MGHTHCCDEVVNEVSRTAGRAVFTLWWGSVLYVVGMMTMHWIL